MLQTFSLRSFIRLADYLIVNTMHVLAVNSVSTLLNYLSEQLQKTPTLSEIQTWLRDAEEEPMEEDDDDDVDSKKKKEEAKKKEEEKVWS